MCSIGRDYSLAEAILQAQADGILVDLRARTVSEQKPVDIILYSQIMSIVPSVAPDFDNSSHWTSLEGLAKSKEPNRVRIGLESPCARSTRYWNF